MKITIEDDFDESIHEFEIPDELYDRAYAMGDKDALYEIAILIAGGQEMSDLPVLDMMSEAWDEGAGSELAGEWLDEYYNYNDDGKYDAWS